MILLRLGDKFNMTLKLYDGNSNKFVRAKLFSDSFSLLGTYDLSHILTGLYSHTLNGVAQGNYHVLYEVFKNSSYTQKDSSYADAEEFFSIRDIEGDIQSISDQLGSKIDDNDGQIA